MEIERLQRQIQKYRHKAAVVSRAHAMAWESFSLWNKLLGIPVVVMTAVVGTAIFGTIQEDPNIYFKVTAGIISMLSAVLAALQTYLNYSGEAERHKEASSSYAKIRSHLDVIDIELSQKGPNFAEEAMESFKHIIVKYDKITKDSPNVPDKIYDAARKSAEAAALPSDLAWREEAKS